MGEKKRVPINESYTYLRKSINNLNSTQSSGPAPEIYPSSNNQNQTTANQPPKSPPSADKK